MKHGFFILFIITIIATGIFLPYVHGDYDYFAVGLSSILQVASFASLLLVPVGLIWFLMDFFTAKRNNQPGRYPAVFRKITLVVAAAIIAAGALGAFVSHNRFSAIIILAAAPYILSGINKRGKVLQSGNTARYSITPYYFIFIPLTVLSIRMTFLERVKDRSTDFVIKQSEKLILDIESYRKTNGHYPISLQSTIEDYKTFVSGIERFHYEVNGNAYNLYFEQFSDIPGTQEIVMYNKLDQHEMTVHNQDLLRIAPANIYRGYHKVVELPHSYWKIFYFD